MRLEPLGFPHSGACGELEASLAGGQLEDDLVGDNRVPFPVSLASLHQAGQGLLLWMVSGFTETSKHLYKSLLTSSSQSGLWPECEMHEKPYFKP